MVSPRDDRLNVRTSVFIATSIDGLIARDDGGLDWLAPMERPGEDYGHAAFMASVDTIVVGRTTWELARGFSPWPYAGKRVVVMTHRPLEAAHGEQAFEGEPASLCAKLEAEGARHAYVDGGQVIRAFLRADRLDELTLSTVPVVLGAGISLWNGTGLERGFRLESSRAFPSGLVQSRYVRTR